MEPADTIPGSERTLTLKSYKHALGLPYASVVFVLSYNATHKGVYHACILYWWAGRKFSFLHVCYMLLGYITSDDDPESQHGDDRCDDAPSVPITSVSPPWKVETYAAEVIA